MSMEDLPPDSTGRYRDPNRSEPLAIPTAVSRWPLCLEQSAASAGEAI